MIIDAHAHLVGKGWIEPKFFLNLARLIATDYGKQSGVYVQPESLIEEIEKALFDISGDRLIKEMDRAEIGKTCVFPVDYGLLTGEPEVAIADQNRLIAQAVQRHRDRLIGFFTIDPRRPAALDLFRRAVEDWHMRGLKLHPSSGWYPYDHAFFPLYRQCSEYKLPLLIHTGGQPGPMQSRFGRPVYIDDIAAAFPDLPIIMAHCGYNWWEEALMVCNMKPNCYVDFSGWQQTFMRDPHKFYTVLRQVLDAIGPWRVLFGSDGPYLNVICPLPDWTAAFRDPENLPAGISFSAEEIEIITGKAFNRLIGD